MDQVSAPLAMSALRPEEVLGPLNELELKHAPGRLYCAGDLSLLRRGPRVAVVGSRRATPEGLRRAQAIARSLVHHHMVVVSGLAEGVDAAAHLAALEAGGATIAILGTPLEMAYPRHHAALQARLVREQLVVSQFASAVPVQRSNFPSRNRTMALLTDATVIVEASETSGTRHQGWEALRLGRQLFLLESVATNPDLSWPRKMIHHGAQVLSRRNLEESLLGIPAVTVPLGDVFAELM